MSYDYFHSTKLLLHSPYVSHILDILYMAEEDFEIMSKYHNLLIFKSYIYDIKGYLFFVANILKKYWQCMQFWGNQNLV